MKIISIALLVLLTLNISAVQAQEATMAITPHIGAMDTITSKKYRHFASIIDEIYYKTCDVKTLTPDEIDELKSKIDSIPFHEIREKLNQKLDPIIVQTPKQHPKESLSLTLYETGSDYDINGKNGTNISSTHEISLKVDNHYVLKSNKKIIIKTMIMRNADLKDRYTMTFRSKMVTCVTIAVGDQEYKFNFK